MIEQRLWSSKDWFVFSGVMAGIIVGLIVTGGLIDQVEASQAVVDAAQATAQALDLQSLLGPGKADCHVTIGGVLHHLQAMIQVGGDHSGLFNMIGTHLTGSPDSLHLVQSAPDKVINFFTSDPEQIFDIAQQLTARGEACLH